MSQEDKKINLINCKGQIAIIAILIVSSILVLISLAISYISVTNYFIGNVGLDSTNAYFLAESGIEDALMSLRQDINYSGGSFNTPIGEYLISVNRVDDNNFNIRSEGVVGTVVRAVEVDISISLQNDRITQYAGFGADNVHMTGPDSIIYGDVWANDDIDFTDGSVAYSEVTSAGRGSFFTSYVNYGAEIKDNPNTIDVIEGNLWSVNAVRLCGGHVYGDVHSENEIFTELKHCELGLIDGDSYPEEDLSEQTDLIIVPTFDFETYKTIAENNGTFFANSTQFMSYVDSLDDGEARVLPDGVYYIETGNIHFDVGNPIKLNGTIISQGVIQFFCGLEINAQNNLPSIVARKDIEFRDYGFPQFGGDFVTINGVVYSERDIILVHEDSGKTINVTGALWAGDNLEIEQSSLVIYDPSVVDTEGFGFEEVIDNINLLEWKETL